jgi:hypothetical protein
MNNEEPFAIEYPNELIKKVDTSHHFGKMAVEEPKQLKQYEQGSVTDWQELYLRAQKVMIEFTRLVIGTIPTEHSLLSERP